MLNKVIIMGRLTRDPELRHTQSNDAVTSFSVAVDRDRKDANGTRKTDFFDVVAWKGKAEFICQYFRKGSDIAISGRMENRKYTAKDGTSRNIMEVSVEEVFFCGRKSDDAAVSARPIAAAPSGFEEIADTSENLPF